MGLEYCSSPLLSKALFVKDQMRSIRNSQKDNQIEAELLDRFVLELPQIFVVLLHGLDNTSDQGIILNNHLRKFMGHTHMKLPELFHHHNIYLPSAEPLTTLPDLNYTSKSDDWARLNPRWIDPFEETQLVCSDYIPISTRNSIPHSKVTFYIQILLTFALETKNIPLIAYLIQEREQLLRVQNFTVVENDWNHYLSLAQKLCTQHTVSEDQINFDLSFLLTTTQPNVHLFKLLLASPRHLKLIQGGVLNQIAAKSSFSTGTGIRVVEKQPISNPSHLVHIVTKYHFRLLKIMLDMGIVNADEIRSIVQSSIHNHTDMITDIISLCYPYDDIILFQFLIKYYSNDDQLAEYEFDVSETKTVQRLSQFIMLGCANLFAFLEIKCPKLRPSFSSFPKDALLNALEDIPLATCWSKHPRSTQTAFITFLLSFQQLKGFLSEQIIYDPTGPKPRKYQNYLDYSIQIQRPHIEGLLNAGINVEYSDTDVRDRIIEGLPHSYPTGPTCQTLYQTLTHCRETLPFSLNDTVEMNSDGSILLSALGFHGKIQGVPRWLSFILSVHSLTQGQADSGLVYLRQVFEVLFHPDVENRRGKINLLAPIHINSLSPRNAVSIFNPQGQVTNNGTILHFLTVLIEPHQAILETVIEKYITDLLQTRTDGQ